MSRKLKTVQESKEGQCQKKGKGPRDLWEEWGSRYADKNKEGVYEFI